MDVPCHEASELRSRLSMGESGLRRYEPIRGLETLGELCSQQKAGRELRCILTTHPVGWEVRVAAGECFSRSQVCATQDLVFSVAAGWRSEAEAAGWSSDR